MTKLCPRGKAAAKRKFKVYPSAYANAYASKICAGKIKDPSGVKRKDFRGRKPGFIGGLFKKDESKKEMKKTKLEERIKKQKQDKKDALEKMKKELGLKAGGRAMRKIGGPMDNKRDVRKVEQMIGGAVSSKREMGREQSTIPPRRFLKGTRRTQSGSINFIRNVPYSEGSLKEAATKLKKENPGFNIRKLSKDDLFRMKRRKGVRKPVAGKKGPMQRGQPPKKIKTRPVSRSRVAGGGLMEATQRLRRQGLRGGGICTKGMNRDAVGKNS